MKLIIVILFIFVFSLVGFGQTVNEEINDLKQFLSIPEKTEIKLKTDFKFEIGKPLKVYLAFGLDTQVYKNFDKWIEEWNKKEAKKYNLLEKVSDVATADVILVRYTKKDKISSETNSKVVSTMTFDPKTLKTTNTPVQQTYSISVVPVLAYVLKPNSGNYEIIERYTDTANVNDNKVSGNNLWEMFKKMLKGKNK